MMRRRDRSAWPRTLLLLLIVSIALACSGPTPPEPTPTAPPAPLATESPAPPAPLPLSPTAIPPTAPTTVSVTPPEAPPTKSPTAGPPGTELRLPTTEPANIDPGLTSDSVSIGILAQVFEGLVLQDRAGRIIPMVAERWDVSPDGLTYVFHLRDGPRWSDGRPVTAGDFEWAWKRNLDPSSESDYASSLLPIRNAERISNGEMNPSELGVLAQDDRTLVVTLERPAAHFLSLAATWTLAPLRRDTVETNGERWVEADNILTNGPYRLAEWTHDQQIVLRRNEDYWGPKPQIERVVFRIFPDGAEEQALAAYEAGELDTFGTAMNLPVRQIDRLKSDQKLGYVVYDVSGTYFLTVNHRKSYLADGRVRKALGMAIERERLIDDVLQAAAEPAYTLQPPGILGRNPDIWPKEDLDAAKRLLAEAGFPDGQGLPEMVYAYNTNAGHKLIGEYLQQRWRSALGITVRLVSMDWNVFLQWRATEDWTVGGDFFRGGWFSDYEDPDDWYNLLWSSASDPRFFNSGWRHDQFDQIVDRGTRETAPGLRQQLYGQAERILADEYPYIPLYHYRGQTLVRSYVKGLEPSRMLGVLPLATMTVEPH